MAEYSIVECAKALNYNSVQAIYNQSKDLESLGYLKTNDAGKKVITEEGLQYLKIKRAANYRNADVNENNIEGKLMITETEIENKFLKEQNKYLKEQVDYFKSKYEESEKDNKLWKEMYMQRDEIILEKERSMLLPVVTKKKKFWKRIINYGTKNSNITNELTYLENMSEHDFKTKSREICKTIIIDQKMIEDGYLNKRKQYEEISGKMLEQIKKDNTKETEKLSFKALDSYLDLTKQEARREYNRRLLKIILG